MTFDFKHESFAIFIGFSNDVNKWVLWRHISHSERYVHHIMQIFINYN